MTLMRAIFPRMFQELRHMLRPETVVLKEETTNASAVDAARIAPPKPEPEPEPTNATDIVDDVPEPEPEPEIVHEVVDVGEWAEASRISMCGFILKNS